MEKGYEVYRAVSPSSSADLVVIKDGKVLRVEVKTGQRKLDGTPICDTKNYRADLLAIVLRDEIVYVDGPSQVRRGARDA